MTTRPTGYATWCASGATNLAQPDGVHQNLGWGVGEAPPSSYFNFLQQQYDQWIRYIDERVTAQEYGDASDGTVTLDGVASFSWATGPSGSAYLLVRDVFAQSITVATGVELQTNDWAILARDTVTVDGLAKVTANGGLAGSASGVTGGLPGLPAVSNFTLAGATGGRGGNLGSLGTTGMGVAPGFGGTGGACVSANGGAPTGVAPISGSPHVTSYRTMGLLQGPTGMRPFGGGGGGAGGQGGVSGAGGGGGGGGGVLRIAARKIVLAGATCLQAYGGNGSTGVGLTSQGGAGGGGGVAVVITNNLSGATLTADLVCRGGIGMPGGQFSGASGFAGTVFLFQPI